MEVRKRRKESQDTVMYYKLALPSSESTAGIYGDMKHWVAASSLQRGNKSCLPAYGQIHLLVPFHQSLLPGGMHCFTYVGCVAQASRQLPGELCAWSHHGKPHPAGSGRRSRPWSSLLGCTCRQPVVFEVVEGGARSRYLGWLLC